jgi:hypothetical protein
MKNLKMRCMRFFSVLALALVLASISVNAQAAPPPSTILNVTPETSALMGINPLQPAQPANTYFYQYAVTDGANITDSIPVQLCLGTSTGTWTSFNVSFSNANGNLAGVTMPGGTTFIQTDTCKTVNIDINTGTLTLADHAVAEERKANINIQPKDKNPNNLNVNTFPTIHISVKVSPAENDTSCFTTNSEGNLLAACNGSAVTASGSDAGRFAITANKQKNIEVSTNPGQFYYNILWTNKTGAQQVVNVNFAGTGAVAKGANAVHAYAFPAPFSGVSQADFQAVNDGIPGGSDGSIENITVPAGWTLWANYHVEWAGLGNVVPTGIAITCDSANQYQSMTGTISGGVDRVCSSGAKGYKK